MSYQSMMDNKNKTSFRSQRGSQPVQMRFKRVILSPGLKHPWICYHLQWKNCHLRLQNERRLILHRLRWFLKKEAIKQLEERAIKFQI